MATQMLTLETRRVLPSDASAMARLSMQLGYDCSEVTMRQRLGRLRDDPTHAIFVAAPEGDQVVGWVHIELRRPLWSEPFAEIMGLVIATNHRRLGIGRALVERAATWAESLQVVDVRARAQAHRDDALEFYEGLGFELCKEQQVYRRTLEDLPSSDVGSMPTLVD